MGSNTDHCIKLLDDIMLTNGAFDYGAALSRIGTMSASKAIDMLEYMNLIDACNCRATDGHYRNSRIYQRAEVDQS